MAGAYTGGPGAQWGSEGPRPAKRLERPAPIADHAGANARQTAGPLFAPSVPRPPAPPQAPRDRRPRGHPGHRRPRRLLRAAAHRRRHQVQRPRLRRRHARAPRRADDRRQHGRDVAGAGDPGGARRPGRPAAALEPLPGPRRPAARRDAVGGAVPADLADGAAPRPGHRAGAAPVRRGPRHPSVPAALRPRPHRRPRGRPLLFEVNGVFAWLRNAVTGPVALLPWLFFAVEGLWAGARAEAGGRRAGAIATTAVAAAPGAVRWASRRRCTLRAAANRLGAVPRRLAVPAPDGAASPPTSSWPGSGPPSSARPCCWPSPTISARPRWAATGAPASTPVPTTPTGLLQYLVPYAYGTIFRSPDPGVIGLWSGTGGYVGFAPRRAPRRRPSSPAAAGPRSSCSPAGSCSRSAPRTACRASTTRCAPCR